MRSLPSAPRVTTRTTSLVMVGIASQDWVAARETIRPIGRRLCDGARIPRRATQRGEPQESSHNVLRRLPLRTAAHESACRALAAYAGAQGPDEANLPTSAARITLKMPGRVSELASGLT